MSQRYWDLLYFAACVIGGGAALAIAGTLVILALIWLAKQDS